jgi:hypothetical protein
MLAGLFVFEPDKHTMYGPAQKDAIAPTEQPEATKVPPAIELTVPDSESPSEPEIDYETPASLLSFVVLIALMWVISSAALSDKRPIAIRAIAKTISSQNHKGE